MNENEVQEALKTVQDPEAGMNVVDLGLVYGIEVAPGKVRIAMTMTSPACPAASYLLDEAAAAIREAATEEIDVRIDLVWDPPWTPGRMSEAAQKRFGWS